MTKKMNKTDEIYNKNIKEELDYALRPKNLIDFIGQEKIKKNLEVYIKAAKNRNEVIDHIIFSGPPGLGKTTLANIVSNELNVSFYQINAPSIEKKGDIVALLTKLKEKDILFIDEIHRLKPEFEEILYSALEDFKINIIMGQGITASSINLNIPKFTLIGATTKTGLLTRPLLSRFGIDIKLDLYPPDDISIIIKRNSKLLNVKLEEDAALEISKRARGTPRIANRLLRRIRDYAEVVGNGIITKEITEYAFKELDIDNSGLTLTDRKLLKFILNNCKGGPVGLETISVSLGETSDTIEDVIEPYLIQEGFLIRTPRGRCITKKTYELFGLIDSNLQQKSLF